MTTHDLHVLHTPAAEKDRPTVAWLDWGRDVFDRAAAERKPILLWLTTTWSTSGAVMDRSTFGDADVIAAVLEGFIPVRVDADRRPDLDDRYNLGGWPTTAFLTPGGEVLWGATYLDAERMRDALRRVAEEFRAPQGASLADPLVTESGEPAAADVADAFEESIDGDATDWVSDRLAAAFDSEYGGFGDGVKYCHAPALMLLLRRCREASDTTCRTIVQATLDAICDGELHDAGRGGFFRYGTNRDWSAPPPEKLLRDQAALLRVLLEASVIFDSVRYRGAAEDLVRYLQTRLADPSGGFLASERRAPDSRPVMDRTLFTDANADAAVSLLIAADVLADPVIRDAALRSFERVMLGAYRPGGGAAHYLDEHGAWVRGLLADQVHAAAALVAIAERTGQVPHLMMAEELMRYAERVMWDDRRGGFYDRAPAKAGAGEYGRLKQRLKPLNDNCLAACVWFDLASLAEQPEYRTRAFKTLASQTRVYQTAGLDAAAYALTVAHLTRAETS